jgi:hypothetical protein
MYLNPFSFNRLSNQPYSWQRIQILNKRRLFKRDLYGEVSKLRRVKSLPLAGILATKGTRFWCLLLLINSIFATNMEGW